MQSVAGRTPEDTEILRLLFLLTETERQAHAANDAMTDLYLALERDDEPSIWRHLQSFLFAAVIVSRLVDGQGMEPPPWPWLSRGEGRRAAVEARADRARKLRLLLHFDDEPADGWLSLVRRIRNPLEHIDEHIDKALNNPNVLSLSDWYLSDGTFQESVPSDPQGSTSLRTFLPDSGFLIFDGEGVSLFGMDLNLMRLRHNAREAQVELRHSLSGGMLTFGRSRLVRVPVGPDAHTEWREMRARIEADMEPPPDLGRVALWLEVGEDAH